MFEVTFLGHQGWMFRTATTCLLADAVLSPWLGHGTPPTKVWPPRALDYSRMPGIDAVFFSHEHSDHFDVRTLAMLDRSVPVLLPARSSRAALALLDEMGFTTHRLSPGDVVTVGDLELRVFTTDHNVFDNQDEWDVLPFTVRDKAGDGSFSTYVDVSITDETDAKMVASVGGKVGVYGYTNNAVDLAFQCAGSVKRTPFDTMVMLARVSDWLSKFSSLHGTPGTAVICGHGFSFEGKDAWMNRNVFPSDNERIAAGISAARQDDVVRAGIPGMTIRMEGGRIVGVAPQGNGVAAMARDQWPDRAYAADVKLIETVEPFLPPRVIGDPEVAELESILDGFASYLYASPLFRAFLSLDRASLADRKATIAMVLRTQDGGYVFEWEPQACQFAAVECAEPASVYVAGIEMWAGDLLAIARGEIEFMAMQLGHIRLWSMAPQTIKMGTGELLSYFSALRRPDIFLRLYMLSLEQAPRAAPVLRHGGASVTVASIAP